MVRSLLLMCLLVTQSFVIVFVNPAQSQGEDALKLDLVLDPTTATPYVGEMILVTLRGIYRQDITREDLKMRDMTDFSWVRLGFDLWTDTRVDGRAARVFERRIALYPRRSGTLSIPPIAHVLELHTPEGGRESVIVRTAEMEIEVAPQPAAATKDWRPLRALELSDDWDADPAQLADGQTVTRRVILRALGATPEMMPPQPHLRQPWLISFTPPEETNFQVTSQGPVTTVIWTWKFRPIKGEPGVIPAVVIPWFDTASRTPETATLPASAIGYASFLQNSATGWRNLPGPGWQVLGLFLISASCLVAMALRERVFSSHLGHEFRQAIGLVRLYIAVRTDDAAKVRKIAAHMLAGIRGLSEEQRLALLRPVDERLYEAPSTETSGSLKQVYTGVRLAMRQRRSPPLVPLVHRM